MSQSDPSGLSCEQANGTPCPTTTSTGTTYPVAGPTCPDTEPGCAGYTPPNQTTGNNSEPTPEELRELADMGNLSDLQNLQGLCLGSWCPGPGTSSGFLSNWANGWESQGLNWWALFQAGWDNAPVAWHQNGQLHVSMPNGTTILFGGIKENAAWGRMGEMATEQRLEAEGYTYQQQITLESSSTGARGITDFMTRDEAGLLRAVEVKTGNGQLSGAQMDIYDDISSGLPVVPYGQNAADFGLEPGSPINVSGLDIDLWEIPDP